MPKRRTELAACALAFAILASVPRSANAQANEKALAQSLFDEGRALMAAGKFTEACEKLSESQRIDPGAGTQANLAVCHEKSGKIVTAWTEFNAVLSQAMRDNRRDREQLARDHIAALVLRLPHLTLKAPPIEVAGLVVEVDGVSYARVAWGSAMPVDPGSHEVRARAPGCLPWTWLHTLREGEDQSVQIPELRSVDSVPVSPVVPDLIVEPKYTPPPPVSTRFSTTFYVAGGIAVASLGTAIVTGAMALSAHHEVRDQCIAERQFCGDGTGVDAASRARTLEWVSTAALGVSFLATTTALLWPKTRVVGKNARVTLSPTVRGAVLFFDGVLF